VGLGPTTVVRLEGALAHEVLRYCTAIRGSVLRVVRGTRWDESTDSTGWTESSWGVDRPQSEARGHVTAVENCHGNTGMRKRPSTQAWTKIREPVRHGQTHVILPCHCATKSGENVLWWCRGAIVVRRHADEDPNVSINTTLLTLVRHSVRAGRS